MTSFCSGLLFVCAFFCLIFSNQVSAFTLVDSVCQKTPTNWTLNSAQILNFVSTNCSSSQIDLKEVQQSSTVLNVSAGTSFIIKLSISPTTPVIESADVSLTYSLSNGILVSTCYPIYAEDAKNNSYDVFVNFINLPIFQYATSFQILSSTAQVVQFNMIALTTDCIVPNTFYQTATLPTDPSPNDLGGINNPIPIQFNQLTKISVRSGKKKYFSFQVDNSVQDAIISFGRVLQTDPRYGYEVSFRSILQANMSTDESMWPFQYTEDTIQNPFGYVLSKSSGSLQNGKYIFSISPNFAGFTKTSAFPYFEDYIKLENISNIQTPIPVVSGQQLDVRTYNSYVTYLSINLSSSQVSNPRAVIGISIQSPNIDNFQVFVAPNQKPNPLIPVTGQVELDPNPFWLVRDYLQAGQWYIALYATDCFGCTSGVNITTVYAEAEDVASGKPIVRIVSQGNFPIKKVLDLTSANGPTAVTVSLTFGGVVYLRNNNPVVYSASAQNYLYDFRSECTQCTYSLVLSPGYWSVYWNVFSSDFSTETLTFYYLPGSTSTPTITPSLSPTTPTITNTPTPPTTPTTTTTPGPTPTQTTPSPTPTTPTTPSPTSTPTPTPAPTLFPTPSSSGTVININFEGLFRGYNGF